MSDISDMSILPLPRSFSMTWGVETTNLLLAHSSFLADGVTSPVNTSGSNPMRCSRRNPACCSTSGFVGAMNRTLPFFLRSASAMTISATIVLPMPVGSTTRVDSSTAAFAMLTWYSLSSIERGFISSCSTNTGL